MILAAGAAAVATTAPGPPSAVAAKRQPNIVLILADDQRAGTLWAMPHVRHLLIDHGVKFVNAFVVNSLCCPSRASILTGDYSHTTGVYANGGPYGGFPAFDDSSTVATWLQGAGYRTALIGKYLNSFADQTYIPPGWNRFVAWETNTRPFYYNYAVDDQGHIRHYGTSPSDYSTTMLTRKAVSFVRHTKGPLFLYFAPYAPHAPATAAPADLGTFTNLAAARPPSFNEKDVSDKPAWVRAIPRMGRAKRRRIDSFRTRQYQALQGVDRAVGRIVSALRDTGRLGDTMIVYMSDNGVFWGEHRLAGKEAAYEEAIRVPMVMRYPRLITKPSKDSHLVLNIDLAPTWAQVAGVQAGHPEGRSLVPLVRGAHPLWRNHFLVEHAKSQVPSIPAYCAIRSKRDLYVSYGTGEQELYNLRKDSYELRNVAYDPRYTNLRTLMRGEMNQMCKPRPPGYANPAAGAGAGG